MLFPFPLDVVIVLIVVGVLLWALNKFPWIDGDVKQIIKVLVIVFTAIWLLSVLLSAFHWPSPYYHRT